MEKKLLERLTKKNCKRQIKQFDNYLSNGKTMIIHLVIGLIKKISYKIRYFPEPCTHSKKKIQVLLDFSNDIKSGLKNATGIDTSTFAKEVDLASLKLDIDFLLVYIR